MTHYKSGLYYALVIAWLHNRLEHRYQSIFFLKFILYLVAYVLCEGALALELVDLPLPESFQLLQLFVLWQVPQLHRYDVLVLKQRSHGGRIDAIATS